MSHSLDLNIQNKKFQSYDEYRSKNRKKKQQSYDPGVVKSNYKPKKKKKIKLTKYQEETDKLFSGTKKTNKSKKRNKKKKKKTLLQTSFTFIDPRRTGRGRGRGRGFRGRGRGRGTGHSTKNFYSKYDPGRAAKDNEPMISLEEKNKLLKDLNLKYKLREQSENITLLVYGYSRSLAVAIPNDINETIRLYSWRTTDHSLKYQAATHLLASLIHVCLNETKNKCEFVQNDANHLDVLGYIYIRGGALRDSCLLRDIKDVDIVINIHELSKAYLNHLQKYHSTLDHQNEDCKCIFWQHFLNKYRDQRPTNYRIPLDSKPFPFTADDDIIDKIIKFEDYIVHCDYLLNARFIVNILERYCSLNGIQVAFDCLYYGRHWVMQIFNYDYNGLQLDNISFDIVDQTGNSYGRYSTFKEYKLLNGADNVDDIIKEIDKYNKHNMDVKPFIAYNPNIINYSGGGGYGRYNRGGGYGGGGYGPSSPGLTPSPSVEIHQPTFVDGNQAITPILGPIIGPAPDPDPLTKADFALKVSQKPTPERKPKPNPKPKPVPVPHDLIEILIPIYPYPMNVVYYDFTINGIHINLYSVLINKYNNNDLSNLGIDFNVINNDDCIYKENKITNNHIDFNWMYKINKKYNISTINKYNTIGLNDIYSKTLNCPLLSVINKCTANFYFWRLVKTTGKFIDKLICGIWTLDDKYLDKTISFYDEWFNEDFVLNKVKRLNAKFIDKFLKWGITEEQDIINRFKALRYIKFEKYFINKLNIPIFKKRLETQIKSEINIKVHTLTFKKCFYQFGYPSIKCYTRY